MTSVQERFLHAVQKERADVERLFDPDSKDTYW
jgi:hypothetical protein